MRRDPQADLLKMFAYGFLANFWINLEMREDMNDREAEALLRLQSTLINEFDATLSGYLDGSSIEAFRTYVKKYRVGVAR